MLTETKAHIRYFEKKLNKLDYAIRLADGRDKQVQEMLLDVRQHYRAAIGALRDVETMNRKDDWEG